MKFTADLNGDILCPYQVLLDISEQITNCPPAFKGLAFKPLCDLNSTNDWINLESLGKPVTIRAKELSDIICSLLNQQDSSEATLDIYLLDGRLTTDNLYSLIFMAESLTKLQINFYTQSCYQSKVQDKVQSISRYKNTQIQYHDCDLQTNDSVLNNQLKNKRMATLNRYGFTLNDEIFHQQNLTDSTLNQLIGLAWICLKSGAYDISCHILSKAQEFTNNSEATKDQIFLHLLMMRFFSHQYQLIAVSDFPESFPSLEAADVKTMQFLKAYSATLSRNLDIAIEYFKKCGINEQMPLSDDNSLYQLNLFALSKVLQGDCDTAFELEFRIKKHIEDNQIEIVGLNYVNFINIARLFKKSKQFDLSLEYYNKAYNEISGGGYAKSDHIYYNMNLGSLCEAAGNKEQALSYWLKASMHWLSANNKYELSWRPRLILCHEKIADTSMPLPIDKACDFLTNKLNEVIESYGMKIKDTNTKVYQFIDDSLKLKKDHCFIKDNVVFYSTTSNDSLQIKSVSTAEHNLAQKVSSILQELISVPESNNSIIVDTQLDINHICSEDAAMAFARLSNCNNCYFNGKSLKLEDFQTLKPMTACLSKVIQSISDTENGLSVSYKRSFLNKTLQNQEEIDFVNKLKNEHHINLDPLSSDNWDLVQKLAEKRLLNFSYPE